MDGVGVGHGGLVGLGHGFVSEKKGDAELGTEGLLSLWFLLDYRHYFLNNIITEVPWGWSSWAGTLGDREFFYLS